MNMNQRTVGLVLIIAGVLAFLWAGSQISSLPPDFLLPHAQQARYHAQANAYRIVQVVGALAAIGGGIIIFRQGATS